MQIQIEEGKVGQLPNFQVVCPGQSLDGPYIQVKTTMSSHKMAIMKAMDYNIKMARSHLSIGWHNPELMEKVDLLYRVLKEVETFEHKLLLDNMDID